MRARIVQLLGGEHGASGGEHLPLFLLDMVRDALLEDLELRAPLLVVFRQLVQLPDDQVGNMVFLVALEHDVVGFRMRFECGVQDPFFDRFVDVQPDLSVFSRWLLRLRPAFGRRLALLEQLLEAAMVGLEQGDRVVLVFAQGSPRATAAAAPSAAPRSSAVAVASRDGLGTGFRARVRTPVRTDVFRVVDAFSLLVVLPTSFLQVSVGTNP